MKAKPLPSRQELLARFRYDRKTGKLFYKIWVPRSGDGIGNEAGTTHKNGRVLVSIKRKTFLRSRIIWTMLKGEIPEGMVIDHKDRNPANDKIGNLRIVTQSVNLQNKGLSVLNTSGFRGVWLHKPTGKWQAACKSGGKFFFGGYHETKEEAAKAAVILRRKYHNK